MSILRLPNELLLHIASFLLFDWDIASLLRANRRLKDLLEVPLLQNNLSEHGGSALPVFAKNGRRSGVQTFLKLGASGYEVDFNFRTAWSYAAENGDFETWQMLLDHMLSLGRELDLNISDERTPLSWAAEGGQLEFAQYLVQLGADVNSKSMEKRTALSYAAQSGHFTIVRWLLDQGANTQDSTQSSDIDGLTPLHYAAFGGHEDIMGFLISIGAGVDQSGLDSMDIGAQTPLMEAARGGQYAAAKMLLEMGANANEEDETGMSPLQYAARAGVGEPLRQSDYFTTSRSDQPGPGWYFDGTGYQAPHKSGGFRDYLAIVKLLVAHGADPNKAHDDYWREAQGGPLYCAAWSGATEIVQFLIDVGADVNEMRFTLNTTALHAAARNGHLDVVGKLLVNGANVNARDLVGHTPLDRAKFAAKLVDEGKNHHRYGCVWDERTICLFEANIPNYHRVVEMLITHGGEVGREDFRPW
jgi:ankyrin repeat protein